MTTAHSLRSFRQNVYASDSDSDSDSGGAPHADAGAMAQANTSDARLMREMDLSTRHETVEYRPNPWSIARINAASRSSLPKPAPAMLTPAPDRPPPKPQSKPIREAFERQAKRDPRGGRPVVRDVGNVGDNSISAPGFDKSRAARRDSRGREHTLEEAFAWARACPQRTEPPSPAQNLPIRAVEALEKEKSAHIPNRFVQPTSAPLLFKPGQISGTRRATGSSPVRLGLPPNVSDVGHAVGHRPTLHRSSPGPRSRAPVSAHAMRRPLPPLAPAPAYTNSRPAVTGHDLPLAHSPRRFSGSMGQGTPPSWLLDALDAGVHASPRRPPLPLAPEPRQEMIEPPHVRTPEPKRKRLASPEPTSRRKIPRASTSASRPPGPAPPATSTLGRFPAAYAIGEDDDPDAEWSTLAKTKRRAATLARRAEKPGGARQFGCFRLPLLGLGLAPRTPAGVPEVKPRVIKYLPPPMVMQKRVDEVDPPTRGLAKHAQVELKVQEEEEEEVEIPTMDSDMTLVNEDEEDVARIDVDDVCVRYHATRACMKAGGRIRKALGCVVELQL